MKKFEPITKEDDIKKTEVYPELCKSCGLCSEICPQQAISLTGKLGHANKPTADIDIEKCIACGQCQNICPDCAIKIKKK